MYFSLYIAKRIVKSSTAGYSGALVKLAIASIALSIAVMLLSTSVILGFKNEISNKIYGFWGNIHITDVKSTRNFELRPIQNTAAIQDSILSISGLKYNSEPRGKPPKMRETKGGVSYVMPFITFPTIISTKNEIEAVVLKGVGPTYKKDFFETYIKEGTFLLETDSSVSRKIMISEQTAARLHLKLDDPINVHFLKDNNQIKRRLNIGAIYKSGLEEYDRKFAFVDMRLIQDVIGWDRDKVGGLEVYVDNIDDVSTIADYIYQEVLPTNLYAQTIHEKQSSIFEWLELQNINESMILLLMIIVGIINMSTALLIIILERSSMIGVLKSLGQTDFGVRKIFIASGVYIICLALILGNLLGLGLGWLQKKFGFMALDEANYYLTQVPIEFDLWSILSINIGAILVTAIVLIIPSFLVTTISPISILRFD